MALSLTRFSWRWLPGKEKEQIPKAKGPSINSLNSLSDWGLGLRGETEGLRFQSVKGSNSNSTKMPPSSTNRKIKRKWNSREERQRRIDKEYDIVLVPSDGVCLSGSETDDSDWSIGWLEPHAPDFQSDDDDDDNDDDADDSFAVLVPCYRHDRDELEDGPHNQFLNAVREQYSAEGKKYMEQWLSSFNNY